ncbi:MAG TPA: TetR/AcrR family transcriptional regulator [Devosia sp.]|jgi:AcrR family transcriptional regulator|nr:TetR/AcrR family transcriptional regulator [Devosia sp.]
MAKVAEKKGGKRERLVKAAVDLAYRQGYRSTTLADLATAAEVPLGNIYYYFKSRDEIGSVILDHRKEEFTALQDRLGQLDTPLARLEAFVRMTVANAPMVAQFGCPMGSLGAELLKEGGDLAARSGALLSRPMTWMAEQFSAMGHGDDADGLALHLQSALQGASLLSYSAGDPSLLQREGTRLLDWLQALQHSGE